jgi:hypothetical protein
MRQQKLLLPPDGEGLMRRVVKHVACTAAAQ